MALSNSMRVEFDAAAVVIAVAALGVLAVGPGVGVGAMVLILGSTGVAGVSAAGVLLAATGTLGALACGGWALADRFWTKRNEGCGLAPPGQVRKAPAPTYPTRTLADQARALRLRSSQQQSDEMCPAARQLLRVAQGTRGCPSS